MRRLFVALLAVFALLPLTLVAPPADASGQPTVPYVKQTALRFRSAGAEVTKTVTVVNPTSEAVYLDTIVAGGAPQFYGNYTEGTCEFSAPIAANSSCTVGVSFYPLYGVASPPYTYTNSVRFTFDDAAWQQVSFDDVKVIGNYLAPR